MATTPSLPSDFVSFYFFLFSFSPPVYPLYPRKPKHDNDTNTIYQAVEAVEVQTHLTDTVVTLVFASELPVGEGSLRLDFRGDINNQVRND